MTTNDRIGGSGYTLDDLSAYFDRGRVPRIDAIEADPEAQALLEAMERVTVTARTLVDEDERLAGDADPAWYERLLGVIRAEVRPGRSLSLQRIDASTTATIAEGALREVVRRAGDEIDGVMVGRVRILVEEGPTATTDVHVGIGVRFGVPLHAAAQRAREAIADALRAHAPAPIGTVDVEVVDLFPVIEEDDPHA